MRCLSSIIRFSSSVKTYDKSKKANGFSYKKKQEQLYNLRCININFMVVLHGNGHKTYYGITNKMSYEK